MKNIIKALSLFLATTIIATSSLTPVYADVICEENGEAIELCESDIAETEVLSDETYNISSEMTETNIITVPDISDNIVNTDNTVYNSSKINDTVLTVKPFDDESPLGRAKMTAQVEYRANKIIDQMNSDLNNPTDLRKTLYLHDWISNHNKNTTEESQNRRTNIPGYSIIVNNEGFCGEHSTAYALLCNKTNIPCICIESHSLNHAWNLLTINNKNYYIDCTWDGNHNQHFDHFLKSRDTFHLSHASEDWTSWYWQKYHKETENVYETVNTSTDYDNYNWYEFPDYHWAHITNNSEVSYNFDDSIFDESYPQETTAVFVNGDYRAAITYNSVILYDSAYYPNELASFTLSDSESSTRYIHDISANGTTVTYHTWLKENGDASTQETHTIDWSEYFSGSCGNTTWSYLNGALTISGSGAMDDYYASQSCPWEDFEDLITEVHIGKDITNITYLPVYEENLTDIYYEGSASQWNDRLRYKSSPLFDSKTIHFGSYDVVFRSKDGNVISTQTVTEGEKATEINAPVISNLTFKAWCTDETLKNEFDFDTLIERDYSLYPKYVKANVTVAFNSNGGSEVGSITVPGESIIEEPEAPTKENFTFVGWFSDEALTKRFDFSTPVLDDITLFAKWAEAEGTATVTFIINGNDTYKTETVAVGDCVAKPVNPVKKNYYFVGWFTEPGYKNLYNFESPVNENISLYGQFAESIFVFFNPNNGENTYSVVTGKGCTVDKPEDPVRSGYTFHGWYTDNNTFKKKFDFSTKLTASATYLYGNWKKGSSPTPPSPTPKEPKVIKTPIAVGQKINVSNTAYMGKTYANYEVSDKKIATIDKKGNLAAKKAGTVIVYGLVKPAKKWVHDPDDGGIKITIESVTVAKANKTITATKTGKQINVSSFFEANSIKPTSYTSSNLKAATVDSTTGIVTTVAKGSSTITALYGEGKNAAKYKLTVKTVIPSISKKTAKLVTGQTLKLNMKNVPKTEVVTWSSSNEAAATVDETGKVTILTYDKENDGIVTITATVDEVDYSCVITVKEPAFSKAKVTVKSGKTTKLALKDTKYKITDCTDWKSSDEDIATVENGVVKGVSGGEAAISCMLGGVEISTTVKVNGPISSKVPIETD